MSPRPPKTVNPALPHAPDFEALAFLERSRDVANEAVPRREAPRSRDLADDPSDTAVPGPPGR